MPELAATGGDVVGSSSQHCCGASAVLLWGQGIAPEGVQTSRVIEMKVKVVKHKLGIIGMYNLFKILFNIH